MSAWEVSGLVEFSSTSVDNILKDDKIIERRATLLKIYNSLPSHTSCAFWSIISDGQTPLEILVRLLRIEIRDGTNECRDRLLAIIISRIQTSNEYWAYDVLKSVPLRIDERYALVNDLCADLYERILRAFFDLKRLFWEEKFLHCLYFERKHAYHSLMIREGYWRDLHMKQGIRVPRKLIASLDQLVQQVDSSFDIEDERARMMFLSIEPGDLYSVVLRLPERLKVVVLLLFWREKSIQDVAQLLDISDRTVRNRLQHALKLLHTELTAKEDRDEERV